MAAGAPSCACADLSGIGTDPEEVLEASRTVGCVAGSDRNSCKWYTTDAFFRAVTAGGVLSTMRDTSDSVGPPCCGTGVARLYAV